MLYHNTTAIYLSAKAPYFKATFCTSSFSSLQHLLEFNLELLVYGSLFCISSVQIVCHVNKKSIQWSYYLATILVLSAHCSPWVSNISIWKSSQATQGEYLLWVSTTCRKKNIFAEVALSVQSLILKHPLLCRLKYWVFLWCAIGVMLWYQGCCIQTYKL